MKEAYRDTIVKIISTYLPHAHIYLFGSRARRDHTPESDIDIAVDAGEKIDRTVFGAIKEAFEESTIPFTIDVVDMWAISDDFKKEVLKDRVTWR